MAIESVSEGTPCASKNRGRSPARVEAHSAGATPDPKSHENTVRQAHYQIEAMCGAMFKAAQSSDTDTLPFLVQALSIRIGALNDALMLSVSGEVEAFKELSLVVSGTCAEASHV